MNTGDSKTNEPLRVRLALSDKLNLKDPNKNMALANLSIMYTWKALNLHIITTNLIYLPQAGMMNLSYLMDQILFQTFKIVLILLLKNMKL